jgi:hypothetical protein
VAPALGAPFASVVAFVRHHHNQWAIFALNLLLGWTLLGWIGALVWSLTRPAARKQTSERVGLDHPLEWPAAVVDLPPKRGSMCTPTPINDTADAE